MECLAVIKSKTPHGCRLWYESQRPFLWTQPPAYTFAKCPEKFCFYLISGTPAAPLVASFHFPQDTTKANFQTHWTNGRKRILLLKLDKNGVDKRATSQLSKWTFPMCRHNPSGSHASTVQKPDNWIAQFPRHIYLEHFIKQEDINQWFKNIRVIMWDDARKNNQKTVILSLKNS